MKCTISSKLVALWFGLAAITTASAVQNNWTGAGGDMLWTNSVNWSLGVLPDSTQDVVISNTGLNAVILDAPAQTASLLLASNALFNLAGNLTVQASAAINGTVEWTSGDYTANGVMTISPSGRLNLRMAGTNLLSGNIVNNGTISAYTTNLFCLIDTYITNNQTFVLNTNFTMGGNWQFPPVPRFINNGTFLLPAGNGEVTFRPLAYFGNSGIIRAETNSTLKINVGSRYSGNIQGGSVFNGPGIVSLFNDEEEFGQFDCQGTMTVNGVLEITGERLNGSSQWSGPGLLRFKGGLLSNCAFDTNFNVQITGPNDKYLIGASTNRGTIAWDESARLNPPDLNAGSGLLVNLGQFILSADCTTTCGISNAAVVKVPAGLGTVMLQITNATMHNSGEVLVETNSTLNFIHRGESFQVYQGTTFGGAGVTRFGSSGVYFSGNMIVNGTVEAACRGIFGTSSWTGPGRFRWLTGEMGGVTFTTNFQVEASTPGDKGFSGTCTNFGTIRWLTPASLKAHNGNFHNYGLFNLETNCTLQSEGGTLFNPGTLRVPANLGEVTLAIPDYASIVSSGKLLVETNSSLLIESSYMGGYAFESGTVFDGPGPIRLSYGSFSFSGNIAISNTVEFLENTTISGSSSWSGPGLFRWMGGWVGGVSFGPDFHVEISGAGDKGVSAPCTNLGAARLLSGSFPCDSAFYNVGLFTLETNCSFAGSFGSYGGFNNAGTLRVPVNMGELTLSLPGSRLINSGTLLVETNSTLILYRAYYENFLLQAGTVFEGATRFVFSGFENAENPTVNGTVELTGDSGVSSSSWNGPGLLRLQYASLRDCIFGPDLHVEMTGSDQKVIDGTCTNFGTFRWLQASPVIAGSGAATFLNNGLFSAEADGAWTNNIALSNRPGGTFKQSTGQFSLTSLNNSGGLELLGGRLNVVSNFVAAPGSSCKVALRGYSPGTDFGQLQANDLTLDGSLVVALANGFSPTNGSTFLIATNAVRHGQFVSTTLPPLVPGLSWQTSYQPTAVTLQVIAPPALGEAAMLPDGSFQFTLTGSAGGTYQIQASTNLVDWSTLTNAPFSGSAVFIDPAAANFIQRFYRGVVQGP